MKFEDPEEKKYFEFMNNNQEFVTNNYLKQSRIFNDNLTDDEKLDYLLDFIKEIYGVVTPNVFKTKLEKIFNLENSNFQEDDYEKMMSSYFKKPIINLENEKDREEFKKIIYDDSIQVSNNQNQNNLNNKSFVLPNAVENSIHISNNNDEEEEEKNIKAEAI